MDPQNLSIKSYLGNISNRETKLKIKCSIIIISNSGEPTRRSRLKRSFWRWWKIGEFQDQNLSWIDPIDIKSWLALLQGFSPINPLGCVNRVAFSFQWKLYHKFISNQVILVRSIWTWKCSSNEKKYSEKQPEIEREIILHVDKRKFSGGYSPLQPSSLLSFPILISTALRAVI